MSESVNPLIPAWYDVAWSAAVVVALVLLVIALISLSRAARLLSSPQALVWTLIVIFAPVAGPLAWMFIGKRSAKASYTGSPQR